MTELNHRRFSLSTGIEMDAFTVGDPANPAIIFLHGFPESHRTWRHQIAHLSGRYRCIAPDQRGYRGSSKPKGVENYTPDKMIGDIFLLATALDVKDFTIVGHDWGGAIAWGVALLGQATGRVTRAVIANAPHPVLFPKLLYTNRQQRQASQYFRTFRDPASDELVEQFGLGGVLLKRGDLVVVPTALGNFPQDGGDWLEVDFDRPRKTILAFTVGVHSCMGAHLARMEVKVALQEWLRRIPEFRVKPGTEIVYRPGGVIGPHHLPLVW